MIMWEDWCLEQKRKENSQGKDPRTFEAPVKKVAGAEKRKEKKWKRKKNEKKKKVKHRRSFWWTMRREQFASSFVSEGERRK